MQGNKNTEAIRKEQDDKQWTTEDLQTKQDKNCTKQIKKQRKRISRTKKGK